MGGERVISLEWAAGFVDGEAHVGLSRHGRTGRFTPNVSIRQCDREPLELLAAAFGGGLVIHRPKTERWNTAWAWQLQRRQAISFLTAIAPHVVRSVIRERIAILVEYQAVVEEYKRNGKRGVVDLDYNARKTAIFERFAALKTRGVRAPDLATET